MSQPKKSEVTGWCAMRKKGRRRNPGPLLLDQEAHTLMKPDTYSLCLPPIMSTFPIPAEPFIMETASMPWALLAGKPKTSRSIVRPPTRRNVLACWASPSFSRDQKSSTKKRHATHHPSSIALCPRDQHSHYCIPEIEVSSSNQRHSPPQPTLVL